jgi:hypothetical protein
MSHEEAELYLSKIIDFDADESTRMEMYQRAQRMLEYDLDPDVAHGLILEYINGGTQ